MIRIRWSKTRLHRFSLVEAARALLLAITLAPGLSRAMEIRWTRMAGQWPVEASPVVADFGNSGKTQILVLNRGGQLMLWGADGTAVGTGQDGLVTQLPPGRWTTAPTLANTPTGAHLLVASVEGLVVSLDQRFQLLWRHKLPGETSWGNATPARLNSDAGPALAFGDSSGTVTCLTSEGKVVWTNALGFGPLKSAPRQLPGDQKDQGLLVGAGSTLFCLDPAGAVRWKRDLGKEVVTTPEVGSLPGGNLIVCGTSSGSLFGLSRGGEVQWECFTGDSLNKHLALLPRGASSPLILCTGEWGNLHAIDIEGRHVWTHLFRTKTRAAPVVCEADGSGRRQVFLPTFNQHLYVFDEDGGLADDLRLSGIMPSAVTPILDPSSGRPDLLVTTTTLLGYRLRPGPARSPYGTMGDPKQIGLDLLPVTHSREGGAVQVQNPHGALLNVMVRIGGTNEWTRVIGSVSARSAFEIPLPGMVRTGAWSFHVTARDAAGSAMLAERKWQIPAPTEPPLQAARPGTLRAWPVQPYGAFDDARPGPAGNETGPGPAEAVAVRNLYVNEAGHGAFNVASALDEAIRARVVITNLASKDGAAFSGPVVLREVVATGSVNGEMVPDALPALDEAGLITLPAHRAVKIWISVDVHGVAPGNYTGRITIAPLRRETAMAELPLTIEVLSLRMPTEYPLTLCTWDYVPNRWFTNHLKEVLDDMGRHGVNVFPRSTIPPGHVDAAGHLTIDWSPLDAELERLQVSGKAPDPVVGQASRLSGRHLPLGSHAGKTPRAAGETPAPLPKRLRGKVLFHLNHPPLEFAVKKSDAEKRPFEVAYILALRDHLRERGWGYDDYAFYLLDEPGLDYGPNVAILVDAGELFREADPKLRTYTDPVPGLSWQDFERIEPLVDLWAPNMRLVSGLLSGDPRIKRILAAKSVWSYECVSQVKSLSPLRYNRANAWRAKFFRLGGIGFWTHSTAEVDLWFSGKSINDEYCLVYPGNLPTPSVRWEAVRDGLQDVSAIALLEQAVQKNRQAGKHAEEVREAEETLRIALRDVMELSDEAFTESRDFLRAGDRVLAHTGTDLEMFRRHRAEIARLTLALAGD
jgi:hypothetical protein